LDLPCFLLISGYLRADSCL
jgi:uncharacterized protein YhaN